jgi:hypothetical protein
VVIWILGNHSEVKYFKEKKKREKEKKKAARIGGVGRLPAPSWGLAAASVRSSLRRKQGGTE